MRLALTGRRLGVKRGKHSEAGGERDDHASVD
jgi:hypothetical protein